MARSEHVSYRWTGLYSGQSADSQPPSEQLTAYQSATLRIELLKAAGTIGAILVPLLIGVFTLRSQVKTAFQVKAVELVMQSPTPWVAKQRALVIERMFPKQLARFGESFDFNDFPGVRLHDLKIELIRLLASNPEQRSFILSEWARQFSGDVHKFGIDSLRVSIEAAQPNRPQQQQPSSGAATTS